MEGYAAVLSRDGQVERGRQVGQVRRQHGCNLGQELLGCPPIECSYGSCSDHLHPRRGGNAGKEDSQCESRRLVPSLARSHAMVQAQISGEQAASMAELISPKRTKNVNEL